MPRQSFNPRTVRQDITAGLFIKARNESTTATRYPHMSQASSTTLVSMIGGLQVLNYRNIIDVVGTAAIIDALAIFLVSFVIGSFLGGKD